MNIKDVLLINEDRIKEFSLLDDNLSPKYIIPMVKVSQDTILKNIIGKHLLNRIKDEVLNDNITDEIKVLLDDFIEDILIWSTLDLIQVPISAKIRNLGITRSNDVNLEQMSLEDLKYNKNFYKNISVSYLQNITEYIIDNYTLYPEYFQSCSDKTKSSYNSGLVL